MPWNVLFFETARGERVISKFIKSLQKPTVSKISHHSYVGNDIYLLHAFSKKSQKTPAKEIKTAEERLKSLTTR